MTHPKLCRSPRRSTVITVRVVTPPPTASVERRLFHPDWMSPCPRIDIRPSESRPALFAPLYPCAEIPNRRPSSRYYISRYPTLSSAITSFPLPLSSGKPSLAVGASKLDEISNIQVGYGRQSTSDPDRDDGPPFAKVLIGYEVMHLSCRIT